MDSAEDREYHSCEWIEGGIAFNRSSLHTCLIAHHDTGLPLICAYRGGAVPIDAVLQARNRIREANRNGGHPQCAGCAHLEKRAWPQHTHPVRIVGIAHYSHCNIECSYCFLQTQDRASFADGFKPYPLAATFEALIKAGALAPDAIIDWGGGEPTIYREFGELLELLLAHGTFHYLHTNGTVIADAIRRTRVPERIHVICSVDAGMPQTYLAMKKRDYLERVWQNLEEYIRLGVKVTAKYIVKTENCAPAELDAFLARAKAVGLKDLIVDIDYNFPKVDAQVVTGIAQLLHGARRMAIQARFGFTGDNFARDAEVTARVAAAYCQEEVAGITGLLNARGHLSSEPADRKVERLVDALESHCASLLAQCLDKEHEIRRLDGALNELRRPGTLVRALAVCALAAVGIRKRPV